MNKTVCWLLLGTLCSLSLSVGCAAAKERLVAQEDCALCGSEGLYHIEEQSLLLLNVNTWEYLSLDDSDKGHAIYSTYTEMKVENGSAVQIERMRGYGLSVASIRPGRRSKPNSGDLTQRLCRECADTIMDCSPRLDVVLADNAGRRIIAVDREGRMNVGNAHIFTHWDGKAGYLLAAHPNMDNRG